MNPCHKLLIIRASIISFTLLFSRIKGTNKHLVYLWNIMRETRPLYHTVFMFTKSWQTMVSLCPQCSVFSVSIGIRNSRKWSDCISIMINKSISHASNVRHDGQAVLNYTWYANKCQTNLVTVFLPWILFIKMQYYYHWYCSLKCI